MKQQVLDISRQTQIASLSPWFNTQLDNFIESGIYRTEDQIRDMKDDIVQQLVDYRVNNNINTVVLGMSGGIDSALTAALYKEAGWKVVGLIMPINQDPSETERGREVCKALKIKSKERDLTTEFAIMQIKLNDSAEVKKDNTIADRIRSGNIRARLRMITLYNEAHKYGGLVASTDNFSELAAGFWTLHGDVGDLAPIQSLLKSWEVPMMARMMGVPESVVTAKPTDGLGVANGDEDQFGCSYLEWDIMVLSLMEEKELDNPDERAKEVYDKVVKRMRRTSYKRSNPINLDASGSEDRFGRLEMFDLQNG